MTSRFDDVFLRSFLKVKVLLARTAIIQDQKFPRAAAVMKYSCRMLIVFIELLLSFGIQYIGDRGRMRIRLGSRRRGKVILWLHLQITAKVSVENAPSGGRI